MQYLKKIISTHKPIIQNIRQKCQRECILLKDSIQIDGGHKK